MKMRICDYSQIFLILSAVTEVKTVKIRAIMELE